MNNGNTGHFPNNGNTGYFTNNVRFWYILFLIFCKFFKFINLSWIYDWNRSEYLFLQKWTFSWNYLPISKALILHQAKRSLVELGSFSSWVDIVISKLAVPKNKYNSESSNLAFQFIDFQKKNILILLGLRKILMNGFIEEVINS